MSRPQFSRSPALCVLCLSRHSSAATPILSGESVSATGQVMPTLLWQLKLKALAKVGACLAWLCRVWSPGRAEAEHAKGNASPRYRGKQPGVHALATLRPALRSGEGPVGGRGADGPAHGPCRTQTPQESSARRFSRSIDHGRRRRQPWTVAAVAVSARSDPAAGPAGAFAFVSTYARDRKSSTGISGKGRDGMDDTRRTASRALARNAAPGCPSLRALPKDRSHEGEFLLVSWDGNRFEFLIRNGLMRFVVYMNIEYAC